MCEKTNQNQWKMKSGSTTPPDFGGSRDMRNVSLLKMLPFLHTFVRETVTTITLPFCMNVSGGSLCTLAYEIDIKGVPGREGSIVYYEPQVCLFHFHYHLF